MLLVRFSVCIELKKILLLLSDRACMEILLKSSVIAFFDSCMLPPKYIFKAAKDSVETSPLQSFLLKF